MRTTSSLLWLSLLTLGTSAAAQITTTRHNFQNQTNPVRVDQTVGGYEDGICVFCHTPHKGSASLLLWNHTMSASSYSWADVTGGRTTGGTLYPNNLRTWTGSTAKCLSCHDGTVSVGSLYWSNANGPVNVTMAGADQTAGRLSNPAYRITDATGADLRGNHPVGVPYSYGNLASTYNGITTGPDVKLAEWIAAPPAGSVKIFGAGGGGAPVAGAAGIECASCHDPHGTANAFLLRVTKANSQLCLSCHVK